jgi:hypothetical protein
MNQKRQKLAVAIDASRTGVVSCWLDLALEKWTLKKLTYAGCLWQAAEVLLNTRPKLQT